MGSIANNNEDEYPVLLNESDVTDKNISQKREYLVE